ncbi:hypothetical protein VTN96DRAFT_6209 [Rasamsonia emersonii]
MSPKRACDCCNIRKVRCNGVQVPPLHRQRPRTPICASAARAGLAVCASPPCRRSGRSRCLPSNSFSSPTTWPEEAPLASPPAPPSTRRISLTVLRIVLALYKEKLYGIWPIGAAPAAAERSPRCRDVRANHRPCAARRSPISTRPSRTTRCPSP